jgi:hypothetical protein
MKNKKFDKRVMAEEFLVIWRHLLLLSTSLAS